MNAAARARSRASAMFFEDLAKTFGKPIVRDAKGAEIIPAGHVKLSQLGIAKAGFTKAARSKLEATAVPADVLKRASQVVQTLRDPALGSYRDWWSKGVQVWKGLVLARTGYPLRNAYDNASVAWGVGARAEYAPVAARAVAVSLGKGAEYADEIIPGLGITYREFVSQARRDGPLTGGFVSSELPKAGLISSAAPTLTKGAKGAYAGFRNANAASENFFRTLVYASKRIGDGWKREDAGRLVDDMLGKYNPAFLSPKEQLVSRYGAPWYNWLKQITKRSARLVGEYPGSIARAAAIPTEINRMQGFTPAQVEALGPGVKAGGAIVRPVKGHEGDVEIFPTTFYGPTDINRIFGTGEWGPPGLLINAARQAYPPVLALAGAFGINPPRGRQFTGESIETVSTVRFLPDWAKKSLGIYKVGERWFAPDRVDYFARMNPALFVSAISDASSDDQQTQKNFRSFVTGLSSYVKNKEQQDFLNQSVEFGAMKDQAETYRRTLRNEQRSLENQAAGR